MKCVQLYTELEDGVVSMNNRDRLMLGSVGKEKPLVPAAHGDRLI